RPYSPPFFFSSSLDHRHLHSFPTRRSSDLFANQPQLLFEATSQLYQLQSACVLALTRGYQGMMQQVSLERDQVAQQSERHLAALDRKSTRLNSSHVAISYAVFCLKKKKQVI